MPAKYRTFQQLNLPDIEQEISATWQRTKAFEQSISIREGATPDRAALVLTSVEGLTSRAAADALGCSEGALEQRLVRARAALRDRQARAEATNHGSR